MSRIQLHHVLSGEGTQGWVHTHGMNEHGLPELEMRGIPGFLVEDAACLLKHICDYMLDSGQAVKLGETMEVSDRTAVRFVKSEPIPGQEEHYEAERWQVVDVERRCGCCGLLECEKS